jgi:exonuclease III
MCCWRLAGINAQHARHLVNVALGDALATAIQDFQLVTQADGNSRVDLWVEVVRFQEVLDTLKDHPQTCAWHIRPHRAYGSRHPSSPVSTNQSARPPLQRLRKSVITWNVRSTAGRRPELGWNLQLLDVAVAAIQEHNIPAEGWPLRFRGYDCVQRDADPAIPGARGVALLVHEPARLLELNYPSNPNTVWGRATGLIPLGACHLGAIYVPAASPTNRERRLEVLEHIRSTATAILQRSPDEPLLILGDWNLSTALLARLLERWGLPLQLLSMRGSRNSCCSRRDGSTRLTAIDHIVTNPAGIRILSPAVVRRSIDMSDHWPVTATLRAVSSTDRPVRPRRMATSFTTEQRDTIVSHNLWDTLLDVDGSGEGSSARVDDPSERVRDFISATAQVAEAAECFKEVSAGTNRPYHTLSASTKTAIQERRYLRAKVREAGAHASSELLSQLEAAVTEAKVGLRDDAKAGWISFCAKGVRLLTDKSASSRPFWRWMKGTMGHGRAKLQLHPVRDPHGVLQTLPGEVLEVYRQHYGALAVDPNPRPASWWQSEHPLPVRDSLPRMDEPISWMELCEALRQAPFNKACGPDGIPVELYKLCIESGENPIPGTAMGKALLEIANDILNGHIPEELRIAWLVSIPKPRLDSSDPENTRGISLISTLMKLVSRIVADRIMLSLENVNGLRREQAGFRSHEECQAQVAVLVDLARRRKHESKAGTWVAFIDFKKAFDTVPHAALMHKLKAAGVTGKCLRFIDVLYSDTRIKVALSGLLSDEIPLERGVRQGDPLSPILFDLFINDIVDDLDTVVVPGLPEGVDRNIPGLLFADDVALIADSAVKLKAQLEGVGAWATKWGMSVGHSKCGVMVLLDSVAHQAAKDQDWALQGSTIPVVDQYVYLGVTLDHELSLATMIGHRAKQGLKLFWALRPFLANRQIHLRIKVLAIKALLVPVLTSGGAVFGMHRQELYAPLQKVLNMAMRTATQGKASALTSPNTLSIELEIPPCVAILAGARARGFAKYKTLRTWIAPLCTNLGPFAAWQPNAPWSRHSSVQTRILWGRSDHPNGVSEDTPKEYGQAIQKARWLKWSAADGGAITSARYLESDFGSTTGYIREALHDALLAPGVNWLARSRIGSTWTAYRAARAGLIDSRWSTQCPLCRLPCRSDLTHILLGCTRFTSERNQHLQPALVALRAWASNDELVGGPVSQGDLTILLLGGALQGETPAFWSEPVAQHTEGQIFLAVSRFLGCVMPRYQGGMWRYSTRRADAPDGVGQSSPPGGTPASSSG